MGATEDHLAQRIEEARRLLPDVRYTRADMATIAGMMAGLGVDGHRGDLVILKTAVAHAAWEGRTSRHRPRHHAGGRTGAAPPPQAQVPSTRCRPRSTQLDKMVAAARERAHDANPAGRPRQLRGRSCRGGPAKKSVEVEAKDAGGRNPPHRLNCKPTHRIRPSGPPTGSGGRAGSSSSPARSSTPAGWRPSRTGWYASTGGKRSRTRTQPQARAVRRVPRLAPRCLRSGLRRHTARRRPLPAGARGWRTAPSRQATAGAAPAPAGLPEEDPRAAIGQPHHLRRGCIVVDGGRGADGGDEGRDPLAADGCLPAPRPRGDDRLPEGPRLAGAAADQQRRPGEADAGQPAGRWEDAAGGGSVAGA